ncbi:MAG: helix-turn-helix domain-containing protein [Deltaproteobacteria bacterium]
MRPTTRAPGATAKEAAPRRATRVRLGVDERRAQLLALGLAAFSERAYDAVSIDDLARHAGISKGLLYHYFPTKRDYYAATLRLAAVQLMASTDSDVRLPPLERLLHGLDAYLAYVEDHALAYTALFRGGIGSDPAVAEIVEATRTEFLQRVLSGLEVARPSALMRLALRGWLGFVEAASLEWVERRGATRAALRDTMAAVLGETITVAMGKG